MFRQWAASPSGGSSLAADYVRTGAITVATTFEVAHIRQQGQDIILIVVDASFARKSSSDQQSTYAALQACASNAGLAGTVALAWDGGSGRMKFYGPSAWNQFLASLDPNTLAANINKKLTCG